jgi:hypothetical protein
MTDPRSHDTDDEPPPLLGTWRRLYTAVVIYLVLLITLFTWFSASFRG